MNRSSEILSGLAIGTGFMAFGGFALFDSVVLGTPQWLEARGWPAATCTVETFTPRQSEQPAALTYSWTDATGGVHVGSRQTATGADGEPSPATKGDPLPCHVEPVTGAEAVLSVRASDNFPPALTLLVLLGFVGVSVFAHSAHQLWRSRAPVDQPRSDRPVLGWAGLAVGFGVMLLCAGAKDVVLAVVDGGPWWTGPAFGAMGLLSFGAAASLRRHARRPTVSVAFDALPRAGDPWTVTWSVEPSEPLDTLQLRLVGTESTRSGDDWRRKGEQPVLLAAADRSGRGVVTVDLPRDLLPSRAGDTHRVEWVVEAHSRWADGEETTESFEVELLPV